MTHTAKILLTGRPGVGKTTVIQRTLALLRGLVVVGFYTQELRGPDGRVGFEAVRMGGQRLGGRRQVLAHVDFRGQPRVGRYGVDVTSFEQEIVPSIDPLLHPGADLLVVDEVGKMECYSALFRETARRALDSPLPVLGTIARSGPGFIAQVRAEARARGDVELIEVTPDNRDGLPEQLAERLKAGRKPARRAKS